MEHNIFIGNNAGYQFIKGKYNIFWGDGAGEDIVECDNTLIIKLGDREIKQTITAEEWFIFNEVLKNTIEMVKKDALKSPYQVIM